MYKHKQNELEFDISEYSFESFSNSRTRPGDTDIDEFEFKVLEGLTVEQAVEHEKVINRERNFADTNNFKIAPVVKEHRGIKDQAIQEREKRIAEEVSKQVAKLKEQAYQEGFSKGIEDGRQEVFNETKAATEEKLLNLTEFINEVLAAKTEIFKAEKNEIYEMIRTLCRWVLLREIEQDDNYLERLLEKLILEMQTKNNLLVQVNKGSFDQMPEVLEHIEQKLGELVNVRVETDFDIEGKGIILSSDNGIINGSLKEQFKSLDKLFESVGVKPIEEESPDDGR